LAISDFVKKTIRSSGGHGASRWRFSEPPLYFFQRKIGGLFLGTKTPAGTKLFVPANILQSAIVKRARTSIERVFLAGKYERVFVQNQKSPKPIQSNTLIFP